jgi:hypothetical protein
MDIQSHVLDRTHRFSSGSLDMAEYLGLLAIRCAHVRFPYREDAGRAHKKADVRE